MTDPGGANNSINDTTVHGTAFQARDVDQVVINHYATPAPASTDGPTDTLLPGWAREVAESPLWQRLPPTRDPAPFRAAARDIAAALAALHDDTEWEATGDPWWDRSFPTRFHGQLSQLLCAEDAPEADFHPAEILLLTLAPYLSQTLWVRTAADRVGVGPADLRLTGAGGDRGDFERYFDRGHERLVRRARLELPERRGAESDIGWWLFHQWVDHGLRGTQDHWTAYTDLTARLPLGDTALGALFHRRRTGQLLYGLRLSLGEMCRQERLDRLEAVASVTGGVGGIGGRGGMGVGVPQQVRVRRLAVLLAVARARALDIPALPDDLVENLGIPYPVGLADLRQTVEQAAWHTDNGRMVLQAADCHHEAVVEALRRHVGQVDLLLYDIRRAAGADDTLAPLLRLPQRASAEGVEAALGDDDRPKFESYGKFQVDPRRVQELLMGDQLYRSPGLAIRELYQNALDACRYRRARTRFLATRPGGRARDDWEGRIRFEQGVGPDGRPYLLCEDNGIGMGESELSRVFARAGTRFTDLTDVRNERAHWERAGIEMHPVSRFGIGVLSYFMIADEIEVITRRLGEDGATSEPCFKVAIHGPHHLFRIEGSAERLEPGTTVRLYLRERAPSCVTELIALLGVAEFETTAEHGMRSVRWAPGEYALRSGDRAAALNAGGVRVPGPTGGGGVPEVLWCESGGGVLVDGILAHPKHVRGVLAGEPAGDGDDVLLRGAVVNLTGTRVPKLSVDRLQILSDISGDVEELLRAAVDELTSSPTGLLSYPWLCSVAKTHPKAADIIAEAAMAADLEFTLGGGRVFRPAQVGCLPLDDGILARVDESYGDLWFDDIYPTVRVTDEVLLWRLLAHGAANQLVDLVPELEAAGPLLPARPSDGVLLAMSERDLARPGCVLRAAETMGVTPRAAVARAVELGIGKLDPGRYPDGEPDPVEVDLLRNGPRDTHHMPFDEAVVWLSAAKPVPLRHFLYAYVDLGLSVTETADRMRSYGFDVSLAETLPDRPDRTDLVLSSQDGEGEGQWFRGDREVPPGHVLWSAERTGLPVAEVCRRLRNHALDVTDPPERQSPEDLRLLSRNHDGRPPWLTAGAVVPFKSVQDAAEQCGMAVADVAAVLTAYGLRPGSHLPVQPTDQDRRLFGSQVYEQAGHGGSGRGVYAWHRVWVRAADLGLSQAAAADRLRALGVPCPLVLPEAPTEFDHALLDKDLFLWQTLRANDSEVPLPLLLITAYELSRPVLEIGARLESYGLRVPDLSTYRTRDRADLWDDIALLSRDLSGPELGAAAAFRPSPLQWLTPGTQVPLRHLCAASTKLGIPLPDVAVRLRGLGIDVPDIADTVRAAMAKLPRPQEQNPA
ncbi:wHTH domain-containing protein [Streptomyces ossamyceticus]|uniref:Histidine kinase/DNA gyrase B/HSP90-like ATPase n=1 Tax=Streptomyces ossamyceticus TaxID=249581 RepID=A0ABV2V3Y9_9ACTN